MKGFQEIWKNSRTAKDAMLAAINNQVQKKTMGRTTCIKLKSCLALTLTIYPAYRGTVPRTQILPIRVSGETLAVSG